MSPKAPNVDYFTVKYVKTVLDEAYDAFEIALKELLEARDNARSFDAMIRRSVQALEKFDDEVQQARVILKILQAFPRRDREEKRNEDG